MPIANKLSRKLQEVFGTEAADAMVDWMQGVEGGRAELRELNDLSFARFDARLSQRMAEVELRLDRKFTRLISDLDAKVDRTAAELNAKIDAVHAEMNARFDTVIATINAQSEAIEARLDATLAANRAELFRWAAMFWIGSLVAMVGAMAAMLKLSGA